MGFSCDRASHRNNPPHTHPKYNTHSEYGYTYYSTTGNPPPVYKISPPQCSPLTGGPFTLSGSKTPARSPARAGGCFRVTFALSRWNEGGGSYINKTKVWEDYDVRITLPGPGAVTLKGKPKIFPAIPRRKGADVINNTLIAWNQVPMQVLSGGHKNFTRKFSFSVRVNKAYVGLDLTFVATTTGPPAFPYALGGWTRTTTLTVPLTAAGHK